MASYASTLAPSDLADSFAALRRGVLATAGAARGCIGAMVQVMLLLLVARHLRRVERLLRAIPTQAAGRAASPSHHAQGHATPELRLTRHGRAFIPRRLRIEVFHIWWRAHRGARAIPGQAAPAPRPHPARAPPPGPYAT